MSSARRALRALIPFTIKMAQETHPPIHLLTTPHHTHHPFTHTPIATHPVITHGQRILSYTQGDLRWLKVIHCGCRVPQNGSGD